MELIERKIKSGQTEAMEDVERRCAGGCGAGEHQLYGRAEAERGACCEAQTRRGETAAGEEAAGAAEAGGEEEAGRLIAWLGDRSRAYESH